MSTKLMYLLLSTLLIAGLLFAQGVDPGTENLTHAWTFNDGSANDYVGGAHGTLMGGEDYGEAEIADGSLFTTYPEQWMELPADQIAINEYTEITCSLWFYSVENANTTYTMFVYFGDTLAGMGVNYYFVTPARGDDKSRAAISCNVLTSTPWSGETGADGLELDDGARHNMVSTLTNDSISLYIDGELAQITPLDTNNHISRISTKFAYIAKSGYSGDPTWMGEILDFKIYNKTLSAEEVEFVYNAGPDTSFVTGIDNKENTNLADEYRLLQNYPNPFNPSTTISFYIPIKSYVSLKVYDITGREIDSIVNDELSAGKYTRQWNPKKNISSGVYFYRLQTENFTASRKLILIH